MYFFHQWDFWAAVGFQLADQIITSAPREVFVAAMSASSDLSATIFSCSRFDFEFSACRFYLP